MFDPVNKILGRRLLRDRYSYNKDEPVKDIQTSDIYPSEEERKLDLQLSKERMSSPLYKRDPYGYKSRRGFSVDKMERDKIEKWKREKYKEHQKENQRKWRKAHPGLGAEYNRRWRQKHPEERREYKKKWYMAHPLTMEQKERQKESQRRYRAAHPERVRERVEKWHQANPEKVRASQRIIMKRWREKQKKIKNDTLSKNYLGWL